MKIAETIYTPIQKGPYFIFSDRVLQLSQYFYQRKIAEIS
jgi:hypothetical protein